MILGLDPGTTVGWALLDFSGNLVKLDSERGLDLNSLITKLLSENKILFIGCDKAKVPSFVQAVARKLGAKVISPHSDLPVSEKRLAVAVNNSHERDAFASAFFAFKKISPLIKRVKRFLVRENQVSLFEEVIEIVVKEQISIKHAFQLLSVEDFSPSVKKSGEYQLDLKKLHSSLVETRSQYRELLKNYSHLAKEHNRLKQNHNHLKQKLSGMVRPKSKDVVKLQYNRKLSQLNRCITEQRKTINKKAEKLNNLENCFVRGNMVALPKIKRLSWSAVQKSKMPFFVEEGSEFSRKAVDFIAGKGVSFVIFKNPPSRHVQKKLPFSCVSVEKFVDLESIVLVNKIWLERLSKNSEVLEKVVEEYQKSRSAY